MYPIQPIRFSRDGERGTALVLSVIAILVISALGGAMLLASSTDAMIQHNEVSSRQAFYIAESGLNHATAWLNAKWSTDPSSGRWVLPEMEASVTPSATKLSYTVPPAAPSYTLGALAASNSDDAIPTSVKVGAGGVFRNVVISGDISTTFPNSYTVAANDAAGASTTYSFSGIVDDFRSSLVNVPLGNGSYSVRAVMLSLNPPPAGGNGSVSWQVSSTSTLPNGATATVSALVTASLVPLMNTVTTTVTSPGGSTVYLPPGVVARKKLEIDSGAAQIDSYKSSKGSYNADIGSGSFSGQLGSANRGSHGDVWANGEHGDDGEIELHDMNSITGTASTTAGPDDDAIEVNSGTIDTNRVFYSQPSLTFPEVPPVPTPANGSQDVTITSTTTLAPGNYRDVEVDHNNISATVPGGTYRDLKADHGTLVLGKAGVTTIYNLRKLEITANATLQFAGPVQLNISDGLKFGANADTIIGALKPSDIKVNIGGGDGDDDGDSDDDSDSDDEGENKFEITGGGNFTGVIYGPDAGFEISGNGSLFGSVVAKEVELKGNGKVHVDEDATNIGGVSYQASTTTTSTTTTTAGYSGSQYTLSGVRRF